MLVENHFYRRRDQHPAASQRSKDCGAKLPVVLSSPQHTGVYLVLTSTLSQSLLSLLLRPYTGTFLYIFVFLQDAILLPQWSFLCLLPRSTSPLSPLPSGSLAAYISLHILLLPLPLLLHVHKLMYYAQGQK